MLTKIIFRKLQIFVDIWRVLVYNVRVNLIKQPRKEVCKMARNNFYVLVFADTPVYVSKVDWTTKQATWDVAKKPFPLSSGDADELAFCLRCNGYNAVVVKSMSEIILQPYRV